MLYSTQTLHLSKKYGLEKAVDMLIQSKYPAIDVTFYDFNAITCGYDSYKDLARAVKTGADSAGVKFIQAHAPFGGGYENYTQKIIPDFPRIFDFCSILGISDIVVHPLQCGRYYGNEEKLFHMNMEFYTSLIPIAKNNGVRIAIENMWQRHPVTKRICDDVCAPPEELARYYDELAGSGVFTVCLDIGHVALCGREPEDAIRILDSERLGCIHAHDVDYVDDLHTLPGVGKINWANVCKALADINYSGSFNLEADEFFRGFFPEQYQSASDFMAQTAKFFAEKIDSLRK